jgi:hypothetical protein
MLSILIPVYKQSITSLVNSLESSALYAEIPYEIIILDDGEGEIFDELNRDLITKENFHIIKLPFNVGRAKIRNKLAEKASFSNLLFLDDDGILIDNSFLENFLPYINKYEVISGGRKYSKFPPEDRIHLLHWLYGRKIESKDAPFRNRSPYLYFHSNNFIVKKEIMLQYPFEERLNQYGYEDLLWAKILEKNGIKIFHIDNPVLHGKLDNAKNYVEKIEWSLKNLIFISKEIMPLDVSIERTYKLLDKLNLIPIIVFIFNKVKGRLYSILIGDRPKIWALQYYKLGFYSRILSNLK